jgi:hypothetical protein
MQFQDKQPMSVSRMVAGLKRQGYQLSFRREATCIYCFDLQERIFPEEFMVDESYYFEDVISPDADRILYAISLTSGGRGVLIDACNVYSDNISYEMEQKLQWIYPLVS